MFNKPMIVVGAVVVTAGLSLAYYLHHRSSRPSPAPVAELPALPPEPTEPAAEYPVPQSGDATNAPLPTLGDSDPPMRNALGEIGGGEAVMRYLVPDNVIRHLVVTIDNLPRQKVPVDKCPTVPASGTFLANGDEPHATLDPKNFARYEPMVGVVRELDMQKLGRMYLHFYPLFQHVYQDLGYPNGYFNDRLVQVIDSLLATPVPTGPIELTRPNVMYIYADRTLEARPAGQKLLMRMGSENAATIKAKLKELRAIITATPPPKH